MTPDEIYRTRKQFFNDSAAAWLDTWYRNPDTGKYDRHQKAFERLFGLVRLKPGDRVLDVGCGSGVLVPWILDRIGPTGILYELDFAEKMIQENRNLHKGENIRYFVADAADTPLDKESCDLVVCFSCFPHFQDKGRTVFTLSGKLRRGGVFVVSHFDSSEEINRHHTTCCAVMHDHLPEEKEMRAFFTKAALSIGVFIDEPGFYCLIAEK